jgi:hypothetical protein
MVISNQVSIDRLIPGKRYIIAINWNTTNNLRIDDECLIYGTYVRYEHTRGRTRSFDSGLQLLLTPARTNAIFDICGQHTRVSIMNKFFEIYKPSVKELFEAYIFHQLKLPLDIKKLIRKDHFNLKCKYRAKPKQLKSATLKGI